MAISFSNVPSGIRVPLFYAEVDNSSANVGTNVLRTLLIGQKLADGVAVVGRPVLVTSAEAGKELFGRGSQLALMNSAYRQNDGFGEVWAIPMDDPSSGKKATCTVAVYGNASASGVISLYIGAQRVAVGVENDAEASAIGSAIASAVSSRPDLPVTANALEGVVTLTAKNAGDVGNDILVRLNVQGYASGESIPEGLRVEVSSMSGGSGAVDLGATIKAMGDEEYDFIAMPFCDTASLDAMKAELDDVAGRWSPLRQLYGHVYAVKRDTVGNLASFGKQRNDQHCSVIGVEQSLGSLSCEVLGAVVARVAVSTGNDPARPLQTLELSGISPAVVGTRFTIGEKQTLLTSGIATLYTEGGYVRIERMITTYQKNQFGDADVSYLDSETLHTLAYIIRDLRRIVTSKYARHKLASDGTKYGPGQAVVTPSVIRGEIVAEYERLEEMAIVENTKLFKKHLVVERDIQNPNRLNVLLPPDLVNQLRIFALLAQFRLQF